PLSLRDALPISPVAINRICIVAILAIAFLLSSAKKRIRLRVVGPAFALQFGIAALVLETPWGAAGSQALANGVSALISYAGIGPQFLFEASEDNPLVGCFALAALPMIIDSAALVSIPYDWGTIEQVVRSVGGAIGFGTGISKIE